MIIKFKKEIDLETLEKLVESLKITPGYYQKTCGCGEGWEDERCCNFENKEGSLGCIFNYIEIIEY